jgi:3-methyladenine DNA glycosylase AlkD
MKQVAELCASPIRPDSSHIPDSLAAFVSGRLAALSDPAKAAIMAAYMKTDHPFHGVQRAGQEAVVREALRLYPVRDRAGYERNVLALWELPHREERYVAIRYARQAKYVGPEALGLYERMIREGAWWDLVDEPAAHLVGAALGKARAEVKPVLDLWVLDPDMWIRRTAVIAQLRLGRATDEAQLFRYCLLLAPEREFFIRKAIGWGLREYSKTAPEAVVEFLETHRERLSPLSLREGGKHLVRVGRLKKGFEKAESIE